MRFNLNITVTLAAILIVTFVAFIPSINNEFTNWDDADYITNNDLIRSLSFANFGTYCSTPFLGNYHPLVLSTYALEYAIAGTDPFLYHLDNILIHVINTCLVFLFFYLLTGRLDTAAVVSILFGVHPMHVESVAWASERKDLLYSLFYLGGAVCYIMYVKRSLKKKFYIFTLILFLLSLLSKGLGITLPLVMLLIDYFVKREFDRKVWLEKVPFFALSIFFGIVAILAQQSATAIEVVKGHNFIDRMFFASYGLAVYFFKLIVPIKLSAFHPYPAKINGALPWVFYITPLAVILLGYLFYRFSRNSKEIVFGGLFFLFTIAPVLQLLPVGMSIIAERYTYISYLGLFFIIAYGFRYLNESRPKFRPAWFALMGLFVLTSGTITWTRCETWKDTITLWTDVIEKHPNATIAYTNRGVYYNDGGLYEQAVADFTKALEIDSLSGEAYYNRGNSYKQMQETENALEDFNKAIDIFPNYAEAYNKRAGIYVKYREKDKALADYTQAIKLKPGFFDAYNNRGYAHAIYGESDLAIRDFNKAIAINPLAAGAYFNRGLFYFKRNDFNAAITDFTNAIIVDPQYGPAYYRRAISYYQVNNYKASYRDALQARAVGYEITDESIERIRRAAGY